MVTRPASSAMVNVSDFSCFLLYQNKYEGTLFVETQKPFTRALQHTTFIILYHLWYVDMHKTANVVILLYQVRKGLIGNIIYLILFWKTFRMFVVLVLFCGLRRFLMFLVLFFFVCGGLCSV